jgi:hypothetical protein
MRDVDKWRHDTDAMSAYGVLRDGTGFCVVKAASDELAREIAKMHNATPEILALVSTARDVIGTGKPGRFVLAHVVEQLADKLAAYDAAVGNEGGK